MGRGDKKTAKGKRFKGSFGNSRPSKVAVAVVAPKVKEAKAPKKAAAKKAEEPKAVTAKKAPAKKKAETKGEE